MNRLRIVLLQLRNFFCYWRELGLLAAIQIIYQRRKRYDVFSLSVRGIKSTVYCRSAGSDFATLRQVLGRRESDIRLGKDTRLIVDAGANVGYSSLLFAAQHPTAQVVAIEPDDANCEIFKKNCASYSNISLLQGALWPCSTALEIKNPNAEAWAFQVGELSENLRGCCVRAFTVLELIEMYDVGRINLLKLDIEGAEHALFTSRAAEWLPLVDVIAVELHDRIVPGCSEAFHNLLKSVSHSTETRGEYTCARLQHL